MNRGASWGSSARAAGLSELIAVNPDGRAEVADSSMRYPNGMVITPDGGTLIVAESQGQCLTAFTIAAGGELSAKRVGGDTRLGPRRHLPGPGGQRVVWGRRQRDLRAGGGERRGQGAHRGRPGLLRLRARGR